MENFPNKDFIGLLSIIYIVVGLFFLLWPALLKRINDYTKVWISSRKLTRPLDMMRDIDEKILQMGKVIGVLSLLLGLVFIFSFARA
ncbi:MAG: hypothetical protein AB1481_00260 [Candidatus Omnitrophota bacterium]